VQVDDEKVAAVVRWSQLPLPLNFSCRTLIKNDPHFPVRYKPGMTRERFDADHEHTWARQHTVIGRVYFQPAFLSRYVSRGKTVQIFLISLMAYSKLVRRCKHSVVVATLAYTHHLNTPFSFILAETGDISHRFILYFPHLFIYFTELSKHPKACHKRPNRNFELTSLLDQVLFQYTHLGIPF